MYKDENNSDVQIKLIHISYSRLLFFFIKLHCLTSVGRALLTLHVTTQTHFFSSENPKQYHAWSCQALTFLLENIFIRFGTKLY